MNERTVFNGANGGFTRVERKSLKSRSVILGKKAHAITLPRASTIPLVAKIRFANSWRRENMEWYLGIAASCQLAQENASWLQK